METTTNRNAATLLQLSAFAQYFFPFGNFIFPIIIWSVKKEDSSFVDYNGKQAINFQLSLLLYTLTLAVIAIPIFIFCVFRNISFSIHNDAEWVVEQFSAANITGIVLIALLATFLFFIIKVAEFIFIIYAAVKNSNGESFNYPLTIKFLK